METIRQFTLLNRFYTIYRRDKKFAKEWGTYGAYAWGRSMGYKIKGCKSKHSKTA